MHAAQPTNQPTITDYATFETLTYNEGKTFVTDIRFEPGTQANEEGIEILEAMHGNQPTDDSDYAVFETLGYSRDEWVAAADHNTLSGIDLNDAGGDFATLLRARDFISRYAPSNLDVIDSTVVDLPGDFDPVANETDTQTAARIELQTAHDVEQSDLLAEIPNKGSSIAEVFGKKGDPKTAAKLRCIEHIGAPYKNGDDTALQIEFVNGKTSTLTFTEVLAEGTTPTVAEQIDAFYTLVARNTDITDDEMRAFYNDVQSELKDRTLIGGVVGATSIPLGLSAYAAGALARKAMLGGSEALHYTQKISSHFGGRPVANIAVRDGRVYVALADSKTVEMVAGFGPHDLPLIEAEGAQVASAARYFKYAKWGAAAVAAAGLLAGWKCAHPTELDHLNSEGLDYFRKYQTYSDFVNGLHSNPEVAEQIHKAIYIRKYVG